MKFQVLSIGEAKKLSYTKDINDCIIISITNTFDEPIEFAKNPHIKGICRVVFDDVEKDEHFCITNDDGRKIVNFVNTHIDKVDEIIVHCTAGISRSAGVCAALMKIINGDDMPIFDSPKYCPNMTCYETVLRAYYGSFDKKESDYKIAHNIAVWQQENRLD